GAAHRVPAEVMRVLRLRWVSVRRVARGRGQMDQRLCVGGGPHHLVRNGIRARGEWERHHQDAHTDPDEATIHLFPFPGRRLEGAAGREAGRTYSASPGNGKWVIWGGVGLPRIKRLRTRPRRIPWRVRDRSGCRDPSWWRASPTSGNGPSPPPASRE